MLHVVSSVNFFCGSKLCCNISVCVVNQMWWWNNVASVRINWRFHAVFDTSEVSKIQCSAVQEYGGKRIEDGLEAVWQFESC